MNAQGDESVFAAIDAGSHTIRLLIAAVEENRGISPLRVERRITRLARGFQDGKTLQEAEMRNSIAVFREYASLLKEYRAGRVVCGATGVIRRAANGEQFLQDVREATGIQALILSEESEALLSMKGVRSVLDSRKELLLTFDLGGGSTEFVLVDTTGAGSLWSTSISTGAATVTERWLTGDPPDAAALAGAVDAIRDALSPALCEVRNFLRENPASLPLRIVGTAGTATTLAAMVLQLTEYRPFRVNGSILRIEWLDETIALLSRSTLETRRGIPGLEPGREDIILGGALIVREIVKGLGRESLTINRRGSSRRTAHRCLGEGIRSVPPGSPALVLAAARSVKARPGFASNHILPSTPPSKGRGKAGSASAAGDGRLLKDHFQQRWRDSMANENMKNIPEALTFDDVSLLPEYSEVLPTETIVKTQLTRSITLGIPLVSAAMDTVTESETAISLAREGGIGIIHRNMSIERQALQVNKVKKSESGMILDPVTVEPDQKISDVLELMSRYRISGVPVVKEGQLVGIITNRDLRFETDENLKVSEVMTKDNLVTAQMGISLEESKKLLHKNRIEKLLVVDEAGCLKGLITIKDIMKVQKYPTACKDQFGRLRVGAAVGIGSETIPRVTALRNAGVDVIAVDSAHGHSRNVIDAVKAIRKQFPDLQIIAGNVATALGAEALIKAGAGRRQGRRRSGFHLYDAHRCGRRRTPDHGHPGMLARRPGSRRADHRRRRHQIQRRHRQGLGHRRGIGHDRRPPCGNG